MLNAEDQYTPASLGRLREIIRQGRPLVLWIGAGASRWADFPSWHDSAVRMRKVFAKMAGGFPDELAKSYLASRAYPELFELCKGQDSALYNRTLLEMFNASTSTAVYDDFIRRLKAIAPLQIVTTNVDLRLEQSLGVIDVIEQTDLERCGDSILKGQPFVAKLHGSISSIDSTIFTKSDYQQIIKNGAYLAAVRSVFSMSSVVFLAYGLQDEYILKLLAEDRDYNQMFGNGPHFLITSTPGKPENGVHRISYKIDQHPDHRAALTVLNVIQQEKSPVAAEVAVEGDVAAPPKKESGFYISSFLPSGTHIMGQSLELAGPDGDKRIAALTGLGFAEGELSSTETVAFHDLAVGLTCFDRVYLPLAAMGLLHDRATPDVFWEMMNSGAVRFVDLVHQPFFVSKPESLIGDLGVARFQNPAQEKTRSSMSVVRTILKPLPGKEEQAEKLIESLEPRIQMFEDSERLQLPSMVRGALLLPSVSKLLGYSDYAQTNQIPRWLAYPTLRFAHLVQTGLICNQLKISASRAPFGGVSLLGAAFSVKPSEYTVSEYAGFVMAGVFGSNLSMYLERNPSVLLAILKFRSSSEGEALRREITDRLKTNNGTEFSSSIEGSLKQTIPVAVLQAARNRFSALMMAQNASASTEAVWASTNNDDTSLHLWRARSRELLLAEAKRRGIKSGEPCVCGSGDRLRDCCLRPLQ